MANTLGRFGMGSAYHPTMLNRGQMKKYVKHADTHDILNIYIHNFCFLLWRNNIVECGQLRRKDWNILERFTKRGIIPQYKI